MLQLVIDTLENAILKGSCNLPNYTGVSISACDGIVLLLVDGYILMEYNGPRGIIIDKTLCMIHKGTPSYHKMIDLTNIFRVALIEKGI